MRAKTAEAFREQVAALGIVATADVCFGEPRIADHRVTVELVAKRFFSGEAMAEIARDYELSVLQVENAVRFWMLPRSRRKEWLREQLGEVEAYEVHSEGVEDLRNLSHDELVARGTRLS